MPQTISQGGRQSVQVVNKIGQDIERNDAHKKSNSRVSQRFRLNK